MATVVHSKAVALYADTPRVATGSTGARQRADIETLTTSTSWVDAEAVAALATAGYGSPLVGDSVTLYDSTGVFSESRTWNGTSWVSRTQYFPGNIFTHGSVHAKGKKTVSGYTTAVLAEGLLGDHLGLVATDGTWFDTSSTTTPAILITTGSLLTSGKAISAEGSVDVTGAITASPITGAAIIANGDIQTTSSNLVTNLNADYLDGFHANQFTQADSAHGYKLSGGAITGTATGTFISNKPGTNQNFQWLKVVIDGTDWLLPIIPV